MNQPHETTFLRVHALSAADELGYRAQYAVSVAVSEGVQYRLVGGHMIRHLLALYPSSAAVQRSTRDADAAVEDVHVIAPIVEALMADNFKKLGGNILVKGDEESGKQEINILLAEDRPRAGLGSVNVNKVGQIDTLPELSFALIQPPIFVDVEASMLDGTILRFETCIPGVETATVLKAHAWKARRAEKDLADLHSLLEIRHEHQEVPWRLDESSVIGRRMDTVRILLELRSKVLEPQLGITIPSHIAPHRLASLIDRHIARSVGQG